MFETFFIFLLVTAISLFPILIWGYIFSYIDENPVNKKRFLFWIIGWALAVVPILHLEKISTYFKNDIFNIFASIGNINGLLSSISFWASLAAILLLLCVFSFLFALFFQKIKEVFWIYIKNIWVFFCFISVLVLFVFLLHQAGDILGLNSYTNKGLEFSGMVFSSVKLIIFYYLVIAFIEESSKHFNFLQSSVLQIKDIASGVSFAIFVALWFAFIENILYLYPIYQQNGWGSELLKIYFFRSIFAVIVHVLCSSVVAYYFSKAYLQYQNKSWSLWYLKLFGFGLAISILLHLVYDTALTLGFGFIMFLYFIFWYLYVSSIFYKDEEKLD